MPASAPDPSTAAMLSDSLARMGLAAPGAAGPMTVLTGGVSSLIVRVDTAHGPLVVKQALAQLKVAARWLAPVERYAAEVAWLRLAARIVPGAVPDVLGVDPVARTFAMSWLDPRAHPVWKLQLRDGVVDVAFAARVADTLARIHAATAGDTAVAAAFDHRAQFHALRLDPYFAATATRHPDLAGRLGALIADVGGARVALMHGDVSPKNLLAGPHGPVILDAECACFGDPAFDAAFCLTHLLLKCAWRPRHTLAYLASFDAFVDAYRRAAAWEPWPGLDGRSAALLSAMLLARVDGKSPVEYLTGDDERDRVRQAARALLAGPPPTLATVRDRWSGAFD